MLLTVFENISQVWSLHRKELNHKNIMNKSYISLLLVCPPRALKYLSHEKLLKFWLKHIS